MGVDYYCCDVCGQTYPDCGPCGNCSSCDSSLCGQCYDDAIEKYSGRDGWSEKCQSCSGEIINDAQLVQYFLEHCQLTRAGAEKLARSEILKGK